jgi:hypothetical protein
VAGADLRLSTRCFARCLLGTCWQLRSTFLQHCASACAFTTIGVALVCHCSRRLIHGTVAPYRSSRSSSATSVVCRLQRPASYCGVSATASACSVCCGKDESIRQRPTHLDLHDNVVRNAICLINHNDEDARHRVSTPRRQLVDRKPCALIVEVWRGATPARLLRV